MSNEMRQQTNYQNQRYHSLASSDSYQLPNTQCIIPHSTDAVPSQGRSRHMGGIVRLQTATCKVRFPNEQGRRHHRLCRKGVQTIQSAFKSHTPAHNALTTIFELFYGKSGLPSCHYPRLDDAYLGLMYLNFISYVKIGRINVILTELS